jgi:hypothetical protein
MTSVVTPAIVVVTLAIVVVLEEVEVVAIAIASKRQRAATTSLCFEQHPALPAGRRASSGLSR